MSNTKQTFNCTTARWELSRILDRVQNRGEHITLERNNRPVAVIVPIADAEKLSKATKPHQTK